MLIRKSALTAACVLLCAPLFSHAELSAKASISGLQFVLTDLTPNDSVAASLTVPPELDVANPPTRASAWIVNFDGQRSEDRLPGVGPMAGTSAHAVLGTSSALSSVVGAGPLTGPYTLTASGTLTDTPSGNYPTTDSSSMRAQAGTDDIQGQSFLLSAHTSLTVNGQADLFLGASEGTPGVFALANTSVMSNFWIQLMAPGEDPAHPHIDFATKQLLLPFWDMPRTASFNQAFSLNYANNTDHDIVVNLEATVFVYATLEHQPAANVPEPSTQALMALGLLGLLGMTRRA